jgi:hypothetical protein
MVDPGTILAIVSMIATVVGSVDKVITLFDSVQNAPKEVREFRVSAARLQRHFAALQARLDATRSALLHEDDIEEIEDTLRSCKDLFSEHEAAFSNQGGLSGVRRTTWTVQSSRKLKRYKGKIDTHYQQIILPIWVESLSSQAVPVLSSDSTSLTANASSSVETQSAERSPPGTDERSKLSSTTSAVPAEDIELLTQGIARLEATNRNNRDGTEKALLALDKTLQNCWIQLGLPVEEIFDNAGLTGQHSSLIPY